MTTYTVLHNDSICVSDEAPEWGPGKPVTTEAVSVVCSPHRRAGILAINGYEDKVLADWCTRNGYAVSIEDGRHVVTYVGGRGATS